MKNKRGDKIISVYWFVILFLVAGAIVYMAALFYGAPYDARDVESEILTNHIADCLSQGGYLKENILDSIQNNFLEECDLNFAVEDVYGWGETSAGSRESGFGGGGASGSFGEAQAQYYVEIGVYDFFQEAEDSIGDRILNIVEGNINLKTSLMLERAEEEVGDKEFVVLHYTAGRSAKDAIVTLEDRGLSIHYVIDDEGRVISKNNVYGLYQDRDLEDAFRRETENRDAAHAGCREEGGWRPECSEVSSDCVSSTNLLTEECMNDGLSAEHKDECCIRGYNVNSIGIELVNLGDMCGSEASYCRSVDGGLSCKDICEDAGRGVEINEIVWEKYTEAQINSLVNLVSGIVSRNNIPINREHIFGHDEITNFKSDPGPVFPWEEFIDRVNSKEYVPSARNFYVLDNAGNQYVIKILAIVGKTEKNVA